MQRISFKKFIPGIAWFFIVLVLMVLPGNELPETDWLNINYFDKIMHAVVFAFLVFFYSAGHFINQTLAKLNEKIISLKSLCQSVFGA